MSERVRGTSAACYLAACILLGGASAAGAIANFILQLLAIVLILACLWTARKRVLPVEASGLVWTIGLLVFFVVATLLPLPAAIWEALPGRAATANGFNLLGIESPSIPTSLAAQQSAASLLWLLPPTAIFLLTVPLSSAWRRRIAWVVLAGAVLSIALSAFQLIGGLQSPLRFYAITNPNRAVGFFANANHLPTLILSALPFTGLLAARAIKSRTSQGKGGGLTLSLSLALFLVVGIAVSASMAGFALLLPTALATFLIHRRTVVGRLSRGWTAALGGLFLLFMALAATGPLNQQVLSAKFSEHPTSRAVIWEKTVEAASDFFPVGSGLGTFPGIYRTYDDPARASNEFVNHAHNDYLEVALELGLSGLLLAVAFVLWWTRRAVRAWREDFRGDVLARTGSIIIGVVLLHSIVDYPLRTSAIAVIFAMAAAFLVPPSARQALTRSSEPKEDGAGLRHLEAG